MHFLLIFQVNVESFGGHIAWLRSSISYYWELGALKHWLTLKIVRQQRVVGDSGMITEQWTEEVGNKKNHKNKLVRGHCRKKVKQKWKEWNVYSFMVFQRNTLPAWFGSLCPACGLPNIFDPFPLLSNITCFYSARSMYARNDLVEEEASNKWIRCRCSNFSFVLGYRMHFLGCAALSIPGKQQAHFFNTSDRNGERQANPLEKTARRSLFPPK